MPQPTAFTPSYVFADFQTAAPTTPLPGNKVDENLNALKTTTDGIRTNLAIIQRDDGKLANASVHMDALSTNVLALLGETAGTPKGAWGTGTAYAVRDLVVESGATYICVVAHTAGTFATDLAATRWIALTSSAGAITITPAGSIAATNVQDAIEELDSEKQPIDATLTAIAGLTLAADKMVYGTGADAAALADLSAFARTLLDDADAATARLTLGVASVADVIALQAATVTAANGLTGGATGGSGALSVGAGTGIAVGADAVNVDKATQANMEAQTADKVVTADNMKWHPGVPKAWVVFIGSTGSVVASYNVSSVTRNAAGNYSILFSAPFSTANYCALAACTDVSGGGGAVTVAGIAALLTTGVQITVHQNNGALLDVNTVCVACFGDQ